MKVRQAKKIIKKREVPFFMLGRYGGAIIHPYTRAQTLAAYLRIYKANKKSCKLPQMFIKKEQALADFKRNIEECAVMPVAHRRFEHPITPEEAAAINELADRVPAPPIFINEVLNEFDSHGKKIK